MSQDAVDQLLDILDLEELEVNLFRGRSPQTGWQRVFGGQVIGQALVAAMRTVDDDRPVHSLHGYFMRPGDPSVRLGSSWPDVPGTSGLRPPRTGRSPSGGTSRR